MTEPSILALKAAGWGILSAISLIIGAVIGVLRNPKKEIRAALMAYGSGALIEALSIELFAHIVHMANDSGSHRRLSEDSPGKPLVYVAMGMAILGGSIFAGLNQILNDAGGFARHASSLKQQVGRRRLIFYARLANKLKSVPMFAKLETQELREIASKMKKEIFGEGEHIFHHEDLHPPIYFLLSGCVRVEISRTIPIQRSFKLRKQSSVFPQIQCDPETGDVHVVEASEDSYLVEPHQLFGEQALITGQPLRVDAIAATDSKVLKLPTHDFIDLAEQNSKIKQFLSNLAVVSMKNSQLFSEACESSMKDLVKNMEMVVFADEEHIYQQIDATAPIYYLVLGHVWLTYQSAEEAFRSSQDEINSSNQRIIRPGKVFGTDNIVRGSSVQVLAVAHDRVLALRLHRADVIRATKSFKVQSVKGFAKFAAKAEMQDFVLPGACGDMDNSEGTKIAEQTDSHREMPESKKRQSSKSIIASMASLLEEVQPARTILEDSLGAQSEITDAELLIETGVIRKCPSDVDNSGHSDSKHDDAKGGHGHNNAHAAIMIWLGILIDAVPESVVLGILSSTSTTGSLLTFVIGVFLANLPEAMSSSGTMAACGLTRTRILSMWSSIVALTGVGAGIGALLFPPGSEEKASSKYAIAAIEGMCGGAMLTMIANTALPEAFEQGGNVVGMSTLMGFLSALFVSVTAS